MQWGPRACRVSEPNGRSAACECNAVTALECLAAACTPRLEPTRPHLHRRPDPPGVGSITLKQAAAMSWACRSCLRQACAALALLAAATPATVSAARIAAAAAGGSGFTSTARSVDEGGRLVISGYRLEGDTADSTFILQRREVQGPLAALHMPAAVAVATGVDAVAAAPVHVQCSRASACADSSPDGLPGCSMRCQTRLHCHTPALCRRTLPPPAALDPGRAVLDPGGSQCAAAGTAAAPLRILFWPHSGP